MKRFAAIAALVMAGCSAPTAPLPGDLQGPEALALSGDELYVASTNSDELRVLELTSDPRTRGFASAPNPIYVLSIPVVTRPIALAADTDGQGHAGPYVFSLSSVSARLGIVVTQDKKEEAEVALPGTPLSVAARSTEAGGARVYIGLALGDQQGAVATVDVPAPGELAAASLAPTVAYPLGRAAPAGLDLSPDGSTLAIGDRLVGAADGGPAGGLIFLQLDGGGMSRLEVGGPVGRVVYSPAATRIGEACGVIEVDAGPPADAGADSDGGAEADAGLAVESFEAGHFLYALVESTGCPLGERCGGIQVVDLDADGGPSVGHPLQVPGIATDVAVAGSAAVDGPSGDLVLGGANCNPTLLLAVPSANSAVYFADGTNGQVFNAPSSPGPSISSEQFIGPDGGPQADAGGGPDLVDNGVLALGGLAAQTLVIQYEGLLPALVNRTATLSAADTLVDPAADFPALGVQAGDLLELPQGCSNTAAVVADAQPGSLTFAPAVADPGCFSGGTYSVRVAGSEPYLVAGSVAGYLGRVAPGGTFTSTTAYAYPQPASQGPALSFQMGAGLSNPAPGAGWTYTVFGGVTPLATPGGPNAIRPAQAIWAPSVGRFYVAYPGSALGGQISEIAPELIAPGATNSVVEYQ